jgi:MscS family membrane protein
MLEFLDQSINNVYLRAFLYLVLTFVALRVVVFLLEKVVLKLTVKTKTNLDDLILKKTSKPITLLVLLVGLKISLLEFPFPEATALLISNLFITLLVISIFYLIYNIFVISFKRVWKRAAKKARTTPNEGIIDLTSGTIKVILILILIIYLLSYWGVEIGPLLAGMGIGGIAIAFALQASLANIFGGISIILDKTVKVGDLVNLPDGTLGKILKISLRATKIKTFDNEIVIVPNSKLANSNIKNVAQPEPKSRVVIPFGVAYGSDIEKVRKVVLSEIKKVKGFVNDPEPSVMFLEMGDSSLNFKAFFFVDSFENRFAAINEANTKIYNALNKAKIEVPFPQMDVHLKKK